MTLAPLPADYGPWLADLKRRIQGARSRAVLAANAEQIRLYHDLGREILSRQATQGWGAKVIDRLAIGLRAAFPDMKDLSASNLKYMKHFAQECPDLAIGQQPADQLPWFHIVTLITTPREGQRPDQIPAQGNALGTRLRYVRALKGRPNPCHNPLPASMSIWFSALNTANHALPMTFAILFTPTWRPCCTISIAPPCSSTRSKIISTSYSNWRAPRPSARRSKQLKPVRPNGSRHRAAITAVSLGKPGMEPMPLTLDPETRR